MWRKLYIKIGKILSLANFVYLLASKVDQPIPEKQEA